MASGAKGRRSWARAGSRHGWMHVHNQDRLASLPWLRKGVQIGKIKSRIPVWEAEVRDRNNGVTSKILSRTTLETSRARS